MRETIELHVNDNPPFGYWHLYIIYTNSVGQEFIGEVDH